MGKVKYADGIDYVSGALSKPKVRNGHSCGSYLIGTHREAPTTNPVCTRLYIKGLDAYKRSTAPSQDEMIARARFAAVTQAVATRSQDLMQINTDKQAFIAQKDTAGGKKTLKSWYWKVCGDAYDAEHPRS
jgi:hypothetical protein